MEIFNPTDNWILALGKTLVHSIWIGMAILAFLKASMQLIPSGHSRSRYRAAFFALLLLTGSVAGMFILLYAPAGPESTSPPFFKGLLNGSLHFEAPGTGWFEIACYSGTWFYLTGMTCFLVHFLISLFGMERLRRSGQQVNRDWYDRFERLKARAGIRGSARLLVSARTKTPVLVGIVRPLVIVPVGMLTQLPISQVETILMHELFHLKRWDQLVNLLQKVIETLLFYHPAVWILSGIMRKERENCCDDLVLGHDYAPLEYASALYQIAASNVRPTSPVPAATGSGRGQLINRIERILNQSTMKTTIRERVSVLLPVLIILFIGIIFSGFTSVLSISRDHPVQNPRQHGIAGILPEAVPGLPALAGEEAETVPAARTAMAAVTIPDAVPDPEAVSLPSVSPPLPDTVPEPREQADPVEEIDWDEIKKELEEANIEMKKAVEEIDWDEIKKELGEASIEMKKAMEEIDWDEIREDMEEARVKAMEEIDWDRIKKKIDEASVEAKKAMEEIDWDKIREDMALTREEIAAMLKELENKLDFDFDFDADFDHDMNMDHDEDVEKDEDENEENLDF